MVVDDASADATRVLLREEMACDGLSLRVLRSERRLGPGGARNAGWRIARAPVVAFTDDDCIAAPGWLAAGVAATTREPGAIVQGATDPIPEELSRMGPSSRTLRIHAAGPYFETCNIFYPREMLERLGGFDASSFSAAPGEDTDLAWRAIEQGARTCYEPAAQVYHAVHELRPLDKLRLASRWTDSMQLFARHPQFGRAHLWRGLYWRPSHHVLLRTLLALALPRSMRPIKLGLLLRYLHFLARRARDEGGKPYLVPFDALLDAIELVSVVRGAVRHRTIVL